MSEVTNSPVRFNELFSGLSDNSVIRTKDGKINVMGNILSSKDFDTLYLSDFTSLLSKYETTITPDFAPTKELYSTLDVLSSPVLKSTGVSELTKNFYKKMNSVIKTNENATKTLEDSVTSYVSEAKETPVFMLVEMKDNLETNNPSNFKKLIKDLMPSSSTLIEGYGTKYNGDDILSLANDGFIEPEQPMTLLKYKSLEAQDENAPDYLEPLTAQNLLEFYSPSQHPKRMLSIVKDNKITPEFTELHEEMLNNVPTQDKKDYIQDLIDESKNYSSTASEHSENLLNYANNKIVPDATLENNISGEFLKNEFLNNKLSIARILDIYITAPKYFSAVESILTPEEISKAHKKNEVSDESLMYIPKDSRIAYLRKNNTKFNTMMYLFLHCNGFSITELKQLLAETGYKQSLELYIDIGSRADKIKELYENYLIDYECIKQLKAIGIISEKDIQKYNFSINKNNFYQEIETSQRIQISGSGNMVPSFSTGVFLSENTLTKTPNSELKKNALKLLGDQSPENYINSPVISHKDEHGEDGFLNGYKIVSLKISNLVALLPENNIKPLYIMPYQEAAYIIHSKTLPNNFAENNVIKEIPQTEKLQDDILKTANQFEESQPYLITIGYNENLDFEKNYENMFENYMKIKIKGDN